jgi:hypothetical protein
VKSCSVLAGRGWMKCCGLSMVRTGVKYFGFLDGRDLGDVFWGFGW